MAVERARSFLQGVVEKFIGPPVEVEPPVDTLTAEELSLIDSLAAGIYSSCEDVALLRKRASLAEEIGRRIPSQIELHVAGVNKGLTQTKQDELRRLVLDIAIQQRLDAEAFDTTSDTIIASDMTNSGWGGYSREVSIEMPSPHIVLSGVENVRPLNVHITGRSMNEDVLHLSYLAHPAEVIKRT